MKKIDIKEHILDAILRGIRYEDMTPKMQEAYCELGFEALEETKELRKAAAIYRAGDMWLTALEEMDERELTNEEKKALEISVQFFEEIKKKGAVFSPEKERIIKAAKMRAKTIAKRLEFNYSEKVSYGALIISIEGEFVCFSPLFNLDEFRFLVNHANIVDIRSVEESTNGLTEISFEFQSDM